MPLSRVRPMDLSFIKHSATDSYMHCGPKLSVFDELLDDDNGNRSIWEDSAYRSAAPEQQPRGQGYHSRIHRKGSKRRALNQREQETNHRRSKTRARVEHVFGDQRTRQGNTWCGPEARCGRR